MNNKKVIVIVGKSVRDKSLDDEIRDNLIKAFQEGNTYDIAYPTIGTEKVLKISTIHNKRNNKGK